MGSSESIGAKSYSGSTQPDPAYLYVHIQKCIHNAQVDIGQITLNLIIVAVLIVAVTS
jgi:hypothetical protein